MSRWRVPALLVRGAQVLLGSALQPADVLIDDGRVVAVGASGALGTAPSVLSGEVVAPGFVDLHVHALDGRGLVGAGSPDVEGLSQALLRRGVTGFLATTIATPLDDLVALVTAVSRSQVSGARLLGVHLEGPWLAPGHAGAQPVTALQAPALDGLERLLVAGPPTLLTLAPELAGADEVISRAREAGVVVSLGHSGATYEQAARAVGLGASHITHCFNAMSGLHHRAPGLAGAALDLPGLTVELIADGAHVHPAVARILIAAVGADRVCLVSDAVDVDLPGETGVRLADGTLAGSRAGLDQAVRNLVDWGVPLASALTMASVTPGRLVGGSAYGGLRVGDPADLVVLGRDLEVQATVVSGEVRWQR